MSFAKKLYISLSSSIFFLLLSTPTTYKITNSLFNRFNVTNKDIIFDPITNCPTDFGHLIHTILFFIIIYLNMIMKNQFDTFDKKSLTILLKFALYGSLIYYFITNNATYRLTSKYINYSIANDQGCPTHLGLLIHTIIYTIILMLVMYLPEDC